MGGCKKLGLFLGTHFFQHYNTNLPLQKSRKKIQISNFTHFWVFSTKKTHKIFLFLKFPLTMIWVWVCILIWKRYTLVNNISIQFRVAFNRYWEMLDRKNWGWVLKNGESPILAVLRSCVCVRVCVCVSLCVRM